MGLQCTLTVPGPLRGLWCVLERCGVLNAARVRFESRTQRRACVESVLPQGSVKRYSGVLSGPAQNGDYVGKAESPVWACEPVESCS